MPWKIFGSGRRRQIVMPEKVPVREGIFHEGPDGSVLLGNKCGSCGQVFFPKVAFCLTCCHDEMKEIEVGPRGKLYSYTVSHMPSSHFEPPYAVGYVDMPEGVRVFAPFEINEAKPFCIGMEMEAVIKNLWQEGEKEVTGYVFRPV
jgi:uncharacterized OB-fold protein